MPAYTYTDAERVWFDQKPFGGFDEDPESAARSLNYHLLGQPDVTLGDPVLAYQTFSQFEYLANELKTVYSVVTPTNLQDMEDARNVIRTALNVQTTARVVDAIQTFAKRAKSGTARDKRLITENKGTLKAAMATAGYAINRYISRVERSQDDDNGRTIMP